MAWNSKDSNNISGENHQKILSERYQSIKPTVTLTIVTSIIIGGKIVVVTAIVTVRAARKTSIIVAATTTITINIVIARRETAIATDQQSRTPLIILQVLLQSIDLRHKWIDARICKNI